MVLHDIAHPQQHAAAMAARVPFTVRYEIRMTLLSVPAIDVGAFRSGDDAMRRAVAAEVGQFGLKWPIHAKQRVSRFFAIGHWGPLRCPRASAAARAATAPRY